MSDTVLLVGGGGREHAIARALAESDASLYACAGNRNPGIARLADGFETLDTTNTTAVVSYAEEVDATLAVVGPEGPLAAGVSDALDDAGIYAFGPHADEARIETDKRSSGGSWRSAIFRAVRISRPSTTWRRPASSSTSTTGTSR